MFFLRSAMAIGAIILILPSSGRDSGTPQFQAARTISASRTLAGDLGAICDRNPAACQTARTTTSIVAGKIETAALILGAGVRHWSAAREAGAHRPPDASRRSGPAKANAEPVTTGTVGGPVAAPMPASRNDPRPTARLPKPRPPLSN